MGLLTVPLYDGCNCMVAAVACSWPPLKMRQDAGIVCEVASNTESLGTQDALL